MNLFIFHRDLRLIDNTSLLKQILQYKKITPIFIFPPQQIDPKKNSYFSNNSVQFMIESLKQLSQEIKSHKGRFYFFRGENMQVLKDIHRLSSINSIAYNIDYTPYAKKRDGQIAQWAKKQKINIVAQEDYSLYSILDRKNTSPKTGKPYLVFTPFKNHCMKELKVRQPNHSKIQSGLLEIQQKLEQSQFSIAQHQLKNFYQQNQNIRVRGGRKIALQILQRIKDFKKYNTQRNNPIIPTTTLSAHLHFTTVSIRQVYQRILSTLGQQNNLINQLHWRDFYMNITHYYPNVLGKNGQKSFQPKFDEVEWKYNQQHMNAWKQGRTGFPIIDAAMRQLNTTGYMHNRCRMIVASFFSKDLFLDWHQGQRYFASKLVDYSPMQNSGGWQWTVGNGTDSQPYFRIFNPWTQQLNYDQNCKYIKKWIPQLKSVPNDDIHKWYNKFYFHLKKGIKYYQPILNHDEARKETLAIYSQKFKK